MKIIAVSAALILWMSIGTMSAEAYTYEQCELVKSTVKEYAIQHGITRKQAYKIVGDHLEWGWATRASVHADCIEEHGVLFY